MQEFLPALHQWLSGVREHVFLSNDGLAPVLARHVAVVLPLLRVPHWLAGEPVLRVASDAVVVVADVHLVVDSGGVVGNSFHHRSKKN